MPPWLKGDPVAEYAWRTITESLHPAILKRVDTLMLAAACRWFSIWRATDERLSKGDGNSYKLMIESATAWKAFSQTASRLGLTPGDRTQLQIPPDDYVDPVRKRSRRGPPEDPMVTLIRRRQEHFAGGN